MDLTSHTYIEEMDLKYVYKKTFLIVAEMFGVLLLAVLIIGSVGAWRLLSGPVDMEFAKPYLEEALRDDANGISVTTDKLALYWPAVNDPLLLGLQGAKVSNAEGDVIASIDEIALNLHKAQLLLGRVRLEGIIVKGPSLSIIRKRDNTLKVGVADLENYGPPERQGKSKDSSIVDTIMDVLAGKGEQTQTVQLSGLKSFAVDDARVFVDDRVLNISWSLPRADISIMRDGDLIEGELVLEEPDALINTKPLEASMLFDQETGNIDVKADLRRFELWELGEKIPELDILAHQNLMVDGQLQANITKDLSVRSAIVHFESEKGDLNIKEWSLDPVPFENLSLDMQYFAENNTVEVSEFAIDLPDTPLKAEAKVVLGGDAVTGSARAEVSAVPHKALAPLWPVSLEEDNAREWVLEKISGGDFSNVFVETEFAATQAEDGPDVEIKTLDAGFDFEGADINYRTPLAPVTDAKGTGRFNYGTDTLSVKVESAKVLDMDLSNGEVELLQVVEEGAGSANIQLDLKGPVQSVLRYIKADPINAKHEIDVANTKGRSDLKVNISLPTRKDVAISEVKIKIDGTMSDVTLPKLVKDMTLTGGPFKAAVADNLLVVTGKGLLDGEPVDAEYREFLESKGQPYKMQVKAKGSVSERIRSKFGIDLDDFLAGPAYADVVYTETDDVHANAVVSANLTNSRFFIKPFKYEKAPGQAADASFKAILKNGSVQKIESLKGSAPTFVLENATLNFRQQNGKDEVASGAFPRFVVGETIGALDFEVEPSGLTKFIMSGQYLDLRPFLGDDDKSAGSNSQGGSPNGAVKPPYDNPPMQISAKADTMRTADDETIQYGQIYADIDGQGRFNQLELDAIAGGADVYLRYKPDEQGRRVFRLEADNAGATLKAFDLYDNVRGGKLVIYAEPKGWLLDRNLVGTAEITDFKVVKAPSLARLLGLLSLPGLTQALNGEGLSFSKLEANFDWLYRQNGSLLVLKDGRTSGNALGLTFDGTFDNAANTLDVTGTIIPLSGVNKMIGEIPLVGDILTGGTGALIAATYSLKGNSDDPKTSVNPLSVLTPGILRRILFEN